MSNYRRKHNILNTVQRYDCSNWHGLYTCVTLLHACVPRSCAASHYMGRWHHLSNRKHKTELFLACCSFEHSDPHPEAVIFTLYRKSSTLLTAAAKHCLLRGHMSSQKRHIPLETWALRNDDASQLENLDRKETYSCACREIWRTANASFLTLKEEILREVKEDKTNLNLSPHPLSLLFIIFPVYFHTLFDFSNGRLFLPRNFPLKLAACCQMAPSPLLYLPSHLSIAAKLLQPAISRSPSISQAEHGKKKSRQH